MGPGDQAILFDDWAETGSQALGVDDMVRESQPTCSVSPSSSTITGCGAVAAATGQRPARAAELPGHRSRNWSLMTIPGQISLSSLTGWMLVPAPGSREG
ncbi:MAG: hypothetical protein WKF47_07240 [Geodermatophilaceae bacterium]